MLRACMTFSARQMLSKRGPSETDDVRCTAVRIIACSLFGSPWARASSCRRHTLDVACTPAMLRFSNAAMSVQKRPAAPHVSSRDRASRVPQGLALRSPHPRMGRTVNCGPDDGNAQGRSSQRRPRQCARGDLAHRLGDVRNTSSGGRVQATRCPNRLRS